MSGRAAFAHAAGAVTRLLGRLSVGRKLALIYLLDLSAVIFISGILVQEKFIAIDFARKELAGTAYMVAAKDALGLAARPVPQAGLVARLDVSVEAIRAAEARWGGQFDSRPAADALIAALARLRAVEARPLPGRPGATAFATAQREAIESARGLITWVGNRSNLILDPDLDSYYTMSLVLLRYPELLETVSRIGRLHATADAATSAADIDDRTQYFILEGRLISVAQEIETDQAQAFAGASDERLKAALSPALRGLRESIERFRQASGRTLEAGATAADGVALQAAQELLLTRLDDAWRVSSAQLDRLLDARIALFFHRMWWHLGTALTLLLAILTAVFFVARQIARPLYRLSEVAERVRLSGDYTLRAAWNSGDEIGRLVRAFNEMLEQLDRHREVQQELVATASAASAQRQLIESMPIAMVVTAIPGHEVLHANRQAEAWLGGRKSDPWGAGMEPGVRPRFFQELADRRQVDEFEVRWRGADGPEWSVLSARRLTYQGRDAVLTAFTPIAHLKLMEQRLELWAKVFEASSEGIVIVDAQRRIVTANTAFCRNARIDLAELVGKNAQDWIAAEAADVPPEDMWPAPGRRGSWRGEVRIRRRDDTLFPAWLVISAVLGAAGEVSHYIWTMLDITERKASEERIHFLAHHDALTRLPNRLLFTERLRMAMQQSQRARHKVAVLFIDLDRFKTINDSLGHHVGDAVLRSVAGRLLQAVREDDTVSRLGGDEFVIALNGVVDSEEVMALLDRRLTPLMHEAHVVDGARLHVSCSIGIAMYPDDASDIDDLMRHADVAMYQAKATGRDGAHFFTPELNERAHRRLRVELLLRQAIERGEMVVHYQPRMLAATGELAGVEALLRWRCAELGELAPADFIPIAEESRLIVQIGAWVVEQVCGQQAAWRRQGLGDVHVSVNVSAVQLREPSFGETLARAMRTWGVTPACLELELTESMLMGDVTESLAQLQALKALGVQLSVDDFGTGYSSLIYLHRFPIDRLKIDRSFVSDMLADATDLAITRAIIGLAHSLGLRVVAEGVETEAVAAALRTAHCDELQGFLYASALLPEEVAEWLAVERGGQSAIDATVVLDQA